MLEQNHQQVLFRWAKNYKGKNHECLQLLHSTGNGIHSTAKHITIAKMSGLLIGLPDIHLPVGKGLWIELKQHNGKVSRQQKNIIELLNLYGNEAYICYGAGEAINIIIKYLEELS